MAPSPHHTSILEQHAEFVRSLAASLLRDRHGAEDLAQDTMLVALAHPPRDTNGLRGWFATVMRRLAARSTRSDTRRRNRETEIVRESARRATAGADRLGRNQESMLEAVTSAVLILRGPYRETVMMR